MKGTICGISNYGTIVEIDARGKQGFFTVPMEWRMFQHFLKSVCGEDAMPKDLLGLEIEYDGNQVYESNTQEA